MKFQPSLKRGEYLGETTSVRDIGGVVASAVTAVQAEPGNGAEHIHENPIISFILEGDSFERIGRRSNLRSAGDIRFYQSGELHQVKIVRFPSRSINFEFESSFLTRYGVSEEMISVAMEKGLTAKNLFLRAYRETWSRDMPVELSAQVLLLGFLKGSDTLRARKKPQWISKLYEILNDSWNESLSLSELSIELNLHPVTISKYFTKHSSVTLGEYIRRLRINKSISLIKNSSLPITDIALHCGFADHSHFTRNFKEMTGFLPKDLRNL